jgi:hypothetical protein
MNARLWNILPPALRSRKALTEYIGIDMGRVLVQFINCSYEHFKLNLFSIEFFENQKIILRFLIVVLYKEGRNIQDRYI